MWFVRCCSVLYDRFPCKTKPKQNKQSKTKTQTNQKQAKQKTKQNMLNWSRPYIVMSSYCIWLFL